MGPLKYESFEACLYLFIIMQLCNFLFSPKIPCIYLFPKINPLLMQHLFETKIFWSTTTDFLLKLFSPHFGRRGACHDVTKSAGSQTNNKSSDNDNMTVEFYKKVYQKTYLPNNFRLRILGNKKLLEKSQIGWRQILVPSIPSRNKFLLIAVKNYTERDFKDS